MKRSLALMCLACVSAVAGSAQPALDQTLVAREAANLKAIVDGPSRPVTLWLDDGAPFAVNRDLYDQAFAACRQGLRADPTDLGIRTNLGALYLWRTAFHPDESGNVEKAVDQFLIVLSKDPANETTLAYLGAYEVLVRVRPELGDQGMHEILMALRETLKDPPNAASLRGLARVAFFEKSMVEARPAAEMLAALSPAPSSYLLLGAIELKMGDADKALSAFQTTLQGSRDPVEKTTATLGLAQAQQALGSTGEADRLLAEAVGALPAKTLEHAARAAGLDTPAELSWAIGRSYVNAGNLGKAVDYLGTEGVGWVSSELASQTNSDGVKLYDNHDVAAARDNFFAAAQMIPMEPVYWANAAQASFDLGRYQESVFAFRKAAALEPLGHQHFGLAMSYAVLGDYRNAFATFEKAATGPPANENMAYWAVSLAYADGGWDGARAAWSRLFRQGGSPLDGDSYDLFVHVWGVMMEIARRAEQRGAHYQFLRHESVLYHILGEGMNRNLLSREGNAQVRQERARTLNRIIDTYRNLPLKPVPPPEVQELVLRAQPLMNSALQDYSSGRQVVQLYEQAIETAPWWPEGHYALALLACRDPFMYAYGELFNREPSFVAKNEMNAYLALAAEGPEVANARKILERCIR